MRKHAALLIFLLTGILTIDVSAADPVAWLPTDVNAVARINVANVYKAPLAKNEGWAKKATESFINEVAFIPPGTDEILIGAQLDIAENFSASRKFAVIVPEAGMTLEKLSAFLPNSIETLAGRPATAFGPDGYVLDAGDGCWLTTGVSSRQAISRWYRDGAVPGGSRVSRYLRNALRSKENSAQFILVIDLQDGFAGDKITHELEEEKWFKSEAALRDAAKTLESVQGIVISINVNEERSGSVAVEFEKDTAVLKPVVDKLADAILDRLGANTNDFHDWKWSVKGKQIVGNGPVTKGAGRKLLSVLEPPSITHAISASQDATPENKAATTSLKYFKSVRILLDDLQEELKGTKLNHALFFERYARKIDEMPRLNVDSALLDYATKVSSSLRYQAQSQRVHSMNASTRMKQDHASSYAYAGSYGWYVSGSSFGTSSVIKAQENQGAKELQISEWKQIEEGMNTLRRSLTEKYQIEF